MRVGLTPRPGRFTPVRDTVPIVWEAGWVPGLSEGIRNISPPLGYDPRSVQPVACRYNDYTTPAQDD